MLDFKRIFLLLPPFPKKIYLTVKNYSLTLVLISDVNTDRTSFSDTFSFLLLRLIRFYKLLFVLMNIDKDMVEKKTEIKYLLVCIDE